MFHVRSEKNVLRRLPLMSALAACCLGIGSAQAADQTVMGPGNADAERIGTGSPLATSALSTIVDRAKHIGDAKLRAATVDMLTNPKFCVLSRAGVTDADKAAMIKELQDQGLVDPADEATFPGGLKAGVFPALANDGGTCPQLPQSHVAAPGGGWHGHHSEPGGLVVHVVYALFIGMDFAKNYSQVYGNAGPDGLPRVTQKAPKQNELKYSEDQLIAGALWHDLSKRLVFQWTENGEEYKELNFGGNGKTDAYGAAGNSKTGAHHILGIAEAMKRGLAPDLVLTQASFHNKPTGGEEYRVVNWLRAGAILAKIDPVKTGYLVKDNNGYRLAPVRAQKSFEVVRGRLNHMNLLMEYTTGNLADGDYVFTGQAIAEVEELLAALAPEFGYDPKDAKKYNVNYRNTVLSYLSCERLFMLYTNVGLDAVRKEIKILRDKKII
jgi:hypothetical protein